MSRFGDPEWGRRRGGRLTPPEGLGVLTALIGKQLRARLGSPAARPARPDLDLALPDSRLVQDALDHCAAECAPGIVAHSIRCYAWGVLLADLRDIRFDREALATAALLHDIELGRTERRDRFACLCFACAGAEGARIFLEARAASPDRVTRVCDAIARHLNPDVPLKPYAESHLLNAAAALDVVGAGARALDPADRARVLATWPLGDFRRTMQAAMRREQAAAPNTRAGLLMQLGFGGLIARAPFGDTL